MTQSLRESSEPEPEIWTTLNTFFLYYLVDRDSERALSMLSDEVYSVGTGEGEIALGKDALRVLFQEEFAAMPNPIFYRIQDLSCRRRTAECWDCFCNMELQPAIPEQIQALYRIRLTAGLHREGERYVIDTLHASEASYHQAEGEFFPMRFLSTGIEKVNRETQQELLEIVSQIMPGGILGGYVMKGFPLYVANERLLRMAGYDSYEAFFRDIQGRILYSIHPEDREYVHKTIFRMLQTGEQHEVEYRMKKQDGSYFWVHDIGRKTDTICRLGGDEFAIFVPNCSNYQVIEEKIRSLMEGYAQMMEERCPAAHSTLSVGGVYGHTLRTL